MRRRSGWSAPFAAVFLAACAADGISGGPQPASLSSSAEATPAALWQLPSQQCRAGDPTDCAQTNSYVMQTRNGSLIVMDGGSMHDAQYLRQFLTDHSDSTPHVAAWFISHPHVDHVGALTKILQDGKYKPELAVHIDRIYGSMLPADTVAKYPWPEAGPEEVQTVNAFETAVTAINAVVTEVEAGQVIVIDNVTIEILAAKNLEITWNVVNNSSVVMRVSDGTKSILFTGDLGSEASQKLLKSRFASRLKADYLQVSHHGQKGADRAFYDVVAPTYCLWPTPRAVWNLPTTKTTLDWMSQMGVLRHYRQFDGLVGIDTLTRASRRSPPPR